MSARGRDDDSPLRCGASYRAAGLATHAEVDQRIDALAGGAAAFVRCAVWPRVRSHRAPLVLQCRMRRLPLSRAERSTRARQRTPEASSAACVVAAREISVCQWRRGGGTRTPEPPLRRVAVVAAREVCLALAGCFGLRAPSSLELREGFVVRYCCADAGGCADGADGAGGAGGADGAGGAGGLGGGARVHVWGGMVAGSLAHIRSRLPTVWSSLLMVKVPALGILVSFAYVTRRSSSASRYDALRSGAFCWRRR